MTTITPTRPDAENPARPGSATPARPGSANPARSDAENPARIEATLATLGCPVFGFAPQPHLAELTATTMTAGARVVGASLSYSYFRNPLNRNHPSNFVPLTPEQTRAIERAESSALPQWMIEQVVRIRYPTLWDAVRTAKVGPAEPKNSLELRLAAHANDVLRAQDPHHVPVKVPTATTTGRLSRGDLLESTCVIVDREPQRARLLQAGPHLTAIGARIDGRYLTVVYDRRTAPALKVEFTVHHPGS